MEQKNLDRYGNAPLPWSRALEQLEQPGGPARFRAVALGLGSKVNGRDTILTPETARKFGVGWIGREEPRAVLGSPIPTRRSPEFSSVTASSIERPICGSVLARFSKNSQPYLSDT